MRDKLTSTRKMNPNASWGGALKLCMIIEPALIEFDTDYVLTIIVLVQNLLDLSSTGRWISTSILH